MGSATFEYVLENGRVTSFLGGMVSKPAAIQLATDLAPYINAGIQRVGYTEASDVNLPETPGEEFHDIYLFGLTYFRNAANDSIKIVLPSPKKANYEIVNQRYSLKKSIGDAIAEKLTTAMGETITFSRGSIISK